jgi:tetratricopeptide (TPR) repeat protein
MHLADEEDELFPRVRSRYNLSSFMTLEDPHEALRIAHEGITLSRQFGIDPANMSGNAAAAAYQVGDFDEVLRLEQAVGEAKTSLGVFASGQAAIVLAMRGDDAGAVERMAKVERMIQGSTSAQDLSELRRLQAGVAVAGGRIAEARTLYREGAEADPSHAPLALLMEARCAVLLGDAQQARSALDSESLRMVATWLQRARRGIEAGLLALEGHRDKAAQLYRQALDEFRHQELRLDLAMTLIERAWLLGDADPEAAAGRDEAQELFAAMGADGFIARLEAAGVGRPPAPVTPTPAAPRGGAAARRR